MLLIPSPLLSKVSQADMKKLFSEHRLIAHNPEQMPAPKPLDEITSKLKGSEKADAPKSPEQKKKGLDNPEQVQKKIDEMIQKMDKGTGERAAKVKGIDQNAKNLSAKAKKENVEKANKEVVGDARVESEESLQARKKSNEKIDSGMKVVTGALTLGLAPTPEKTITQRQTVKSSAQVEAKVAEENADKKKATEEVQKVTGVTEQAKTGGK